MAAGKTAGKAGKGTESCTLRICNLSFLAVRLRICS